MPEKPNILLILTDQHRLSAVGAYGDTPCKTPNLDRLAAQGVRFENAYTTCPVCSPARASIVTGLYPHAHGMCTNVHELGCSVHELPDSPQLLSRRLEQAGYLLGYTGKWHLGTDKKTAFGGPNRPSLPSTIGFSGQDFPGHGGGGFWYPQYNEYLARKGFEHKVTPPSQIVPQCANMGELAGPIESTVPHFLAEHTISLLDKFQNQEKPFFIWHNFWGPHEPYYATKEFIDLYRDVQIPPWPNYDWPSSAIPGPHNAAVYRDRDKLNWDNWAAAIRYYYAFASMIDNEIGRIISHLAQRGLLDNTLIVFAADHGETLGSHGGLCDKGWHHFEETHRIPLIVRLPDADQDGLVRSEFISLVDMYPTILEMAGLATDDKAIHGESFLQIARGRQVPAWRDSVVVEFGGLNGSATTQRTLRYRNLKYGYNCSGQDDLYDLAEDPHEMRNCINCSDYKDMAHDLRRRLLDWMDRTNDPARLLFEAARK